VRTTSCACEAQYIIEDTQSEHDLVARSVTFPEPGDHRVCATVYFLHGANLEAVLVYVDLVDAQGVDPDYVCVVDLTQALQR
jgi:hypothetical protein